MSEPVSSEAPPRGLPYRGAPDLLEEAAAVAVLSSRLAVEEESGEGPGAATVRQYLLRRAAVTDRLVVAHPGVERFRQDWTEAARALVEFDAAHPEMVPARPVRFGPPESRRAYVRRCYADQVLNGGFEE